MDSTADSTQALTTTGTVGRVVFATDINPLLAEAFLEEAPGHATRFGDTVERLVGESASLDDVVQAQRIAHTIKGSANITGVAAIAGLTHATEDVLDALAESGRLPPPGLGAVLVETADCVAAMVDALRDGGGVPPATADLTRRLHGWHGALELGSSPAAHLVQHDSARSAGEYTDAGSSRAAHGSVRTSIAPEEPGAAPRAAVTTLRVPVDLVDRLLRLAGELAVSNVQSQGAHQRMTAQGNSLSEQYHLVKQRLSDLQDRVELRGVPSVTRRGPGATNAGGGSADEFDPLELDEYNDLHSKSTALAEAVTDFCELALELRPELARLDDTISDQQRIGKEMSDAVMSARMVPVGSIESRLQRVVRETCRVTGKQAQLAIIGGDLPVDGDVLAGLVDPLLHMLRNAIDHGLEPPGEREGEGKPARGALSVDFSREGDNVRVTVGDDGRGFDVARIRGVAEARGLLPAGEARTERELLQLAVLSGFSTCGEATHISGRGIGMDVVHRAVLDLKGSMDIASSAGRGASISLRVPLTLISMHVLLVRAGERVYGVPSGSLEQVLFSDAGTIGDEGTGMVFSIDGREYRVACLDALTGRGPSAALPEKRVVPMMLLEADRGPTAVAVDAAVDGRYLVVNSLGARVPRPPGVIGASILGDGSVAPVLDLRELLRRRAGDAVSADSHAVWEAEPAERAAPEVLVVDDSLTARRMLAIALTDGGYRVRTAIDGLDAVEAVEDSLPDLVVTDLEMPRMNGLELLAHLRAEERSAALPALMVTSRSTEKHRALARAVGINAFITKPYAHDELLARVGELLAGVPA